MLYIKLWLSQHSPMKVFLVPPLPFYDLLEGIKRIPWCYKVQALWKTNVEIHWGRVEKHWTARSMYVCSAERYFIASFVRQLVE